MFHSWQSFYQHLTTKSLNYQLAKLHHLHASPLDHSDFTGTEWIRYATHTFVSSIDGVLYQQRLVVTMVNSSFFGTTQDWAKIFECKFVAFYVEGSLVQVSPDQQWRPSVPNIPCTGYLLVDYGKHYDMLHLVSYGLGCRRWWSPHMLKSAYGSAMYRCWGRNTNKMIPLPSVLRFYW